MQELIIDQQQHQPNFHKQQIVWAKILGWPWWPAKITQIPTENNGVYKVQFFCDTSHAFLPSEKLIHYVQGRDRHSTPKGHYRNFAKALLTADKLLQSTSIHKDDAQSQTSFREKLVVQQNQIINYSQQVHSNKKIENQNNQQGYQPPIQKIIKQKVTKKLKKPIRRLQKHRPQIKRQQIEQAKKQVELLLLKFKLDSIQQNTTRRIPKLYRKKSKFGQKNFSEYHTKAQIQSKIARMIFKALSYKGIPLEQRFKISTTLMHTLIQNEQKGVKVNHRALFQWIRCSDSQTIIQNYKAWPQQDKNEDTSCRVSS